MINNEYITGYSIAIVSLAEENNKLEIIKNNSMLLLDVFGNDNSVVKFFDANENNSQSEKFNVIENTFGKDVDQIILNSLKLLIRKNKVLLYKRIFDKVIKMINQKLGLTEAVVYSVDELNSGEFSNIKSIIENKIKKSIHLENHIDKELISGIKVVVDGLVVEDNVISRMKNIRKALLNK